MLIGHSQGSYHLIRLLAQDIEPDAALRYRLVSALLLGAPVSVPRGQDVGGSFQHVPLCRAADQTGCAVSYSAFAAGVPLPEPGDSPAFGRVPAAAPGQPEQHAACVNPAALTGGQATLHPYFTAKRTFPILTAVQRRLAPWTDGAAIDTLFVTLPDFVTGECAERGGVSFLEVRVTPHPGSPRTTELGGTVNVAGRDLRAWGLHLIDIDLAQGDLIGLVRTQTAAWLAQPRPCHSGRLWSQMSASVTTGSVCRARANRSPESEHRASDTTGLWRRLLPPQLTVELCLGDEPPPAYLPSSAAYSIRSWGMEAFILVTTRIGPGYPPGLRKRPITQRFSRPHPDGLPALRNSVAQ